MNRFALFYTDKWMADFTSLAMRSFRWHNPAWAVRLIDLGLMESQRERLHKMADSVVLQERWVGGASKQRYPAGLGRCQAIADWVNEHEVMIMLDADTVTFGSIDGTVEQFLESGRAFGFEPEGDPRFPSGPVAGGWVRRPDGFPNFPKWRGKAHLPTGVMLATGRKAAEIALAASDILQRVGELAKYAEQTAINAALYENDVEYFRLGDHFHCFYEEQCLEKCKMGYIVDGDEVIIRHYQGQVNKRFLKERLLELNRAFVSSEELSKTKYDVELKWNIDDIEKCEDYKFIYFGVEDHSGNVIYRYDAPPASPECMFARSQKDVTIDAAQKPAKLVIWPVSHSRGWLRKVEYAL